MTLAYPNPQGARPEDYWDETEGWRVRLPRVCSKNRSSQAPVTGRVTDAASNVFANRQGRAAVRQQTEQWLNACFLLAVNKESGAHASHREPWNSDNDFENRKQCLKL